MFVLFSLPQAVLLAVFWRRVEPWLRAPLFASIALLLVIPAYNVGFMSDFTQRASIVPHCVVAFAFNALLIELCEKAFAPRRERQEAAEAQPPQAGTLVAGAVAACLIALIGAATPALELYDTLSTPRWSYSDCNQLTANLRWWGHSFVSTYLAPAAAFPAWLFPPGAAQPLQVETRTCWPDRIYGERKFNYMLPQYRIWLSGRPAEQARSASAAQR